MSQAIGSQPSSETRPKVIAYGTCVGSLEALVISFALASAVCIDDMPQPASLGAPHQWTRFVLDWGADFNVAKGSVLRVVCKPYVDDHYCHCIREFGLPRRTLPGLHKRNASRPEWG